LSSALQETDLVGGHMCATWVAVTKSNAIVDKSKITVNLS